MGKWSPPRRVITTRAIKWWHCQSKAVFWYCVSCISFPVWSPKGIFFSFWASGGSKTEILIKGFEESREGEQSPVAIRRLCFLSLCRPKVISGPDSSSLSLAGSRNHAPILWNNRARVSSLLQLWKDPFSHIVDGYLELCSKIQSQGKNCSENWNGPAASHPPPKTLINVPGAPRPQTTESWSLVMLASLFLALLWNMWSISQAREFCCSPWGVLPLPEPLDCSGDLCLKPSAPRNISFRMLCIVMLHVTLCIALIRVLYQRAPSHLLSWMGAEWFKSKHLTLNLSWAGLQASSFWSKTEAYQGPGIKAE